MSNKGKIYTHIDKTIRRKIEYIACLNHTNMSEIVRNMIEHYLKHYDQKELDKLILKHNKWLARNPQ